MRIRSIKPEFWRSSDISELDIEDRLLFIGMWSYVDDNGVGLDKLSTITADLFADDLEKDPQGTFARVSRGLANLSARGRILRYTLERVDYLSITNWSKHQRIDRPGKPRLPQHDAELATIREGVASPPVNVPPGAVDQGAVDQGAGSSGGRPPKATGTKLPHDWKTTNEHLSWALENCPNIDEKLSTQKFKSHYRSVAGPAQFKTNWDEAWKAWLISDQAKAASGQPLSGSDRRIEQGRQLAHRAATRTHTNEFPELETTR